MAAKVRPDSHVLLITGPPGSGKTTLVQQLAQAVAGNVEGFLTVELRDARQRRIGFDAVDLRTGQRYPLARKDWYPNVSCRVGRYGVRTDTFDPLIRTLQQRMTALPDLWIIDELGKMEACSRTFLNWLETTLTTPGIHAVCTGPLRPLPAYRHLLERVHPEVWVLTPNQRTAIQQRLLHKIQNWLRT